jgi:RNA polymerase sigma-70 factor (ECF subfamily)
LFSIFLSSIQHPDAFNRAGRLDERMGQPDSELMQRWQRGETAAFEELVRRWQQPMARFLVHQIGHPESIQDLCQEVFLKVYQARDRYHETGVFSSWLYRIALNVARDASRRFRNPARLALNQMPHANGTPAATRCEQQEIQEAISAALAALPPLLREVLVLRHYEEMNFEDMGRLMSIPASTLKSRFALALRKLRDQLEERGIGPEEIES